MNEFKKETRSMWQDVSQQLKSAIDRMIRKNTLAKIDVMAINCRMTRDEFNSKVSFNPRTVLTNAERFAIESEIAELDPETFAEYLQTIHPNLSYIKSFLGGDQ